LSTHEPRTQLKVAMPATIDEFTAPDQENTGTSGKEEKEVLAEDIRRQLHFCLAEASGWLSEAKTSQRYYRSDQFRRGASRLDRDRVRLVANFIRRDVDLMVAEILDGKPVVNPGGRSPRQYELGRQLIQILEWSRDEEENWDSNQEYVITDCFHIGEGILYEGWNQDADMGMGRPIGKWIDSRYVFWDPGAREPQKDDADYVYIIEHEKVDKIEARWPQLKDKVETETVEAFLTAAHKSYYRSRRHSATSMPRPSLDSERRAWVIRCWRKKERFESYYFYEDGEPATAFDEEGDEVVLTEDLYDKLPEQEKAMLLKTRAKQEELWETVVVGQEVVENRISPFDQSNGGHGKYPLAFFSHTRLPDESHARGEIGFLLGAQDITNETVTMFLNQLFLGSMGYLHTEKGSMDEENMGKAMRIGRDPFTILETTQGLSPPEWRAMNPTGMNAAANAIPVVKDIMEQISGVRDVDRGTAPSNVQSGRAIRALQAKTNLLSTKVRRHIESGLRRATVLRMHNIAQFMRGSRMAEVVDANTRESKVLFIGHSEEEVAYDNQLQQEQDPQTGEAAGGWTTPEGKTAEIVILNDKTVRDVVFERVRLSLDTGLEQNRLERMDQAEMAMNTVGPAAIPWAAKMLEWPNVDELLDSIDEDNQGKQLLMQMEEIQKQTGMSPEEVMAQLMAMVEQQQMMQAAGEEAGPGGAPPPPGGPPPGEPPPPGGPPPGGPPPGAGPQPQTEEDTALLPPGVPQGNPQGAAP